VGYRKPSTVDKVRDSEITSGQFFLGFVCVQGIKVVVLRIEEELLLS
jgi:hypothetical protein